MTDDRRFDSRMLHLRAIQTIPGDTAGEKYRWIARLASHRASGDSEQQLPPELLPILRAETAVKKKIHEDVTLALRSADETIVNRAFKADWFFDGSHKETVDVAYFLERLFPYVSLKTRTRIVGALAYQLTGKDSAFAREMFTAVAADYGLESAHSLLIACDEDFVFETIKENRLALPYGIVKKIFRKNPDLVVRFLRLLRPTKSNERRAFAVTIDAYKSILPKLIKKRLEAFVELYEMHETDPPSIVLSNTGVEMFLKKGLPYLLKKPRLYVPILQLKKINEEVMETIFPELLPANVSSFDTGGALRYLEHYPLAKRYELLRKSYRSKYGGVEMVDEPRNVTPELLRILPIDERVEQARMKIAREKLEDDHRSSLEYETAWICYLPIDEAIPAIKERINKSPQSSDRLGFIWQLIYTCKINEDEEALHETLEYFMKRHKNEDSWVYERTMDQVAKLYDAFHLSERNYHLLSDIARLFYVKYGYAVETIFELLIHFKLLHDQPIEEEIFMLIETNRNHFYINFNIIKEYPQRERQCLEAFAKAIKDRYRREGESLDKKEEEERNNAVFRIVRDMYDFNERCEKSRTKMKLLTIKDYPWLMDIVSNVLSLTKTVQNASYPVQSWNVERILKKREPELCRTWFATFEKIADLKSGEALALLKRDPQSVLEHWRLYFAEIENRCHCRNVQRFVRATRWYKDIPIHFATRCINDLSELRKDEKNANKVSSRLAILAILLQSDSTSELTELITPFLPTKTTVETTTTTTTTTTGHLEARNSYHLVRSLSLCMRLSNPPMSLDIVAKLCEGDYLTTGLMVLKNLSTRSPLPRAMSFAEKLANMRVGTRKHGIRLMYALAPIREFNQFLRKMWDTETHHSVREILFQTCEKLFLARPSPENWSLYSGIILKLTLKDEVLFSKLTLPTEMPDKYVEDYLGVWLEAIENFSNTGLDVQIVGKYTVNCLQTLTEPVQSLLSESFAAKMVENFLFHDNINVSQAARPFAVSYLLPEDKNKFVSRIERFAKFFRETVRQKWDVGHVKKSRYYPANNIVRSLMDDLVVDYVEKCCSGKSIDPGVIDEIRGMFLSVLKPTMDAKSYLMLVYAKEWQECASNEESFGLKLARQMPELVGTLSSLLIPYMADVLEHFLERVCKFGRDLDENRLRVAEDLVESGSEDSSFMAINILPRTVEKNSAARYDRLVEKFKKMENPAVRSILYDCLNEADFETIVFD